MYRLGLIIALLLSPLPATALLYVLPQSGQALSLSPGDDGDRANGRPWPQPRFIHHGDGTLTDRLSGLVWIHDAYCAQQSGYLSGARGNDPVLIDGWPAWFIRQSPIAPTCRGYQSDWRDWRLPTLNDLLTLVQSAEPALRWLSQTGSAGFIDIGLVADGLWSATPGPDPRQRWVVDLASGSAAPEPLQQALHALPPLVRGPLPYDPPLPPAALHPRFLVDARGRVHDRLTGLVWLPLAACISPAGEWLQALRWAESIADHPDCPPPPPDLGPWRLPRAEALVSLIAPQRRTPALPEGFPWEEEDTVLWSATATPTDPGNRARALHTGDGRLEGDRPLDRPARALLVSGPDPSPDLQTDPSSLTLQADQPTPLTLHALTLAESPLRIQRLATSPPFSVTQEDCTEHPLIRGETCTVTLRARPTSDGALHKGTLEIEFNGAFSPRQIPLQVRAPASPRNGALSPVLIFLTLILLTRYSIRR